MTHDDSDRFSSTPVAVSIEWGDCFRSKFEPGDKITIRFHGVATHFHQTVGFALVALGLEPKLENETVGCDVVCELTVQQAITFFSPAYISGGKMRND